MDGYKKHAVTSCSWASQLDLPQSYSEAAALFQSAHKRRGGARGRITHNTYIETGRNGWYSVRLHETHILTFHADGSIVLNTGGWQTTTTRDRINRCGIRIGMRDGVPSVYWDGREHPYVDGMTLAPGVVMYPYGRVPFGSIDVIRRRRRNALRRSGAEGTAWRWPGRQGGWTPYAGTVPEAFA